MSYPYRLRVSQSVERSVAAEDEVCDHLSLTAILPESEMRELMAAALEGRGFRREGERMLRESEDGAVQELDLESMTIRTRMELEEEIKKEKSLEVIGDAWSEEEREAQRERHRRAAEARLAEQINISDQELELKRKELIQSIGERLASTDEERRRELNEAVSEVYSEALKKKARALGTVMGIEERRSADGNDFELRIKITE